MRTTLKPLALLAAAALLLPACTDDMVGTWELDENNPDYSETWTLESDGSGDLDIRSGGQKLSGDVDWEDNGKDMKYDVTLRCKSVTGGISCSQVFDKIKGECEINDAGNRIDCTFEGYSGENTYDKVDE